MTRGITISVNGASPAFANSVCINSDPKHVDIGFPTVNGGDKVVLVIKQGFFQEVAGNKNSELTMPTITVGGLTLQVLVGPSQIKSTPTGVLFIWAH